MKLIPVSKSAALVRYSPHAHRLRSNFTTIPAKQGFKAKARGKARDAKFTADRMRMSAAPRARSFTAAARRTGEQYGTGVLLAAGGAGAGYGATRRTVAKSQTPASLRAQARDHKQKSTAYTRAAVGSGVASVAGMAAEIGGGRSYARQVRQMNQSGSATPKAIYSAARSVNRSRIGSAVGMGGVAGALMAGAASTQHDDRRREKLAQARKLSAITKSSHKRTAALGATGAGAGVAASVAGQRLAHAGIRRAATGMANHNGPAALRGARVLHAGQTLRRIGQAGAGVGAGVTAAAGVSALKNRKRVAKNSRTKSRAERGGGVALNTGLTVAGLGAAARTTGSALQRSGNRALSNLRDNPRGSSTFGAGASKESIGTSRRAQRAIKTGSVLRRSAKHLPYGGGALAVGGGAVMASEHMKRRKAAVAKSQFTRSHDSPRGAAGMVVRRSGVKKREWSDAHFTARKKTQGALSGASGVAGIAGLGALIASRGKSPAAATARKLTAPLTTTSAGVGGLSSLNFASISQQEAKRAKKETARAKQQSAKINQLDRRIKSISKAAVAVPNTKQVLRKPAPVAGRTLSEKNKVVHQKAVLSNVMKSKTSLSPETKRLRRLDRYESSLGAGGASLAAGSVAGAAAQGARKHAPKIRAGGEVLRTRRMDGGRTSMRDKFDLAFDRAKNTPSNVYSDGSPKIKRVGGKKASSVRRVMTAAQNNPLKGAGIGVGVGAAMVAGSKGVNRYKNSGGKSYKPLPREQA